MFDLQIDEPKIKNIKEGYINIPKDYLWCMDCNALTSHKQPEHIDFSWQKYYRHCLVCDDVIDTESHTNCPECGWNYGPFYENISEQEIQTHLPGCHNSPFNIFDVDDEITSWDYSNSYAEVMWYQFIRKYPQFKNIEMTHCSCPKYLIITDPYCYESSSGSVFSMECYDAMEWTLLIRCPICGERFEISDGNC